MPDPDLRDHGDSAFAALLRRHDVAETTRLASPHIGFMAFHGGTLEKTTDAIADNAARRCNASYYGVVQRDPKPTHVASKLISPADSESLAAFIDHCDTVVTVHGYGRQHLRWSVLLGGRNRVLARHVASHLRRGLPQFDIVDDLAAVPVELAGQHWDNPVNRPKNQGVQIELPPLARWNIEEWHWSDHEGRTRAPQTEQLIDALAAAAAAWIQLSS